MRKIDKPSHPLPEPERFPLHKLLRVDEIKDASEGRIEVNASERAAIGRTLDLVALDRLALTYRLGRIGGGRIGLTGSLEASVTQTCVVTLAPVAGTLDVPVEIEFWPAERVAELEAKAADTAHHEVLDWPEPIIDGKIDLGPVLYESLATALDPYPRAEGATFDWPPREEHVANPSVEPENGPFAALERLKRP